MPNQPKTPNVVFRCPPDLREQLERIAAERGERLTDVVLRACRELAANWPAQT